MEPLILTLGLIALVAVGGSLIDLTRHQVRSGPRWLWALLCVATFPLGVILYWTVARIPTSEEPVLDPTSPTPGAAAPVLRPGPTRDGRTTGTSPTPTGPPVIATFSLTKRYGETAALDQVTMTVPRGATYGLIGPNNSVVTPCATGSGNVGDAYRVIERGEADMMFAGGTEAPITAMGIGGFAVMKALSTRNESP